MFNDYRMAYLLDLRDDARAEWADADPCECDGTSVAPTYEMCEWCEAEAEEEEAAEAAERAAASHAEHEATLMAE